MKDKERKIGFWALVMLIFVPTFGFNNITTNAVVLGPAAIPSWFIVSLLYFLPLSIVIAELASANQEKEGGLYSWMACGLGEKWAFVGTWSYYIASLFYLQMVFARIPIMVSFALFGENRFTDANANMLVYLSLALAVALTYIATLGVKKFSKIADVGGQLTLVATVLFIIFAILLPLKGIQPATTFTASNVMPQFNSGYFSTFSWLILAVAGAEVAGTYIKDVENPNKIFPKGVLIATLFIMISYTLGSLAVCYVASPEAIQEAGLKNAGYVVYQMLADYWGLSGVMVVRIYALIYTVGSVAAYVIWMESPIRAMFSEVPEHTFPNFMVKKREDGTLVNALWLQCGVLLLLIVIPLFGLGSVDKFIELLTNLSALSLVIPYMVLIASYLVYRLKGNKAPFTFLKSKGMVLLVFGVVMTLSVFAFFGAGTDYISGAQTSQEAIAAIVKTYLGPIILIAVGYILVWINRKCHSQPKVEETNSLD